MFLDFQDNSTTECTDEAGKVLKPSNDNPFIESSQPNVVDMRGMGCGIGDINIVKFHIYYYLAMGCVGNMNIFFFQMLWY